MKSIQERVADALTLVDNLDRQSLLTLRANSLKHGEAAIMLLSAIDARLAELDEGGGMATHRLNFAREMLRIVERARPLEWIAARDMFERAKIEQADNPYVVWIQGNSAREIPLTKALADVSVEFPSIERRKDASGRVYFRLAK